MSPDDGRQVQNNTYKKTFLVHFIIQIVSRLVKDQENLFQIIEIYFRVCRSDRDIHSLIGTAPLCYLISVITLNDTVRRTLPSLLHNAYHCCTFWPLHVAVIRPFSNGSQKTRKCTVP
jgi:hypothetical protein